jgi:hypothetical protein
MKINDKRQGGLLNIAFFIRFILVNKAMRDKLPWLLPGFFLFNQS